MAAKKTSKPKPADKADSKMAPPFAKKGAKKAAPKPPKK